MNKELTPLEAFYELGDNTPVTDNWRIVEAALKRLERYENEIQSIGEMIAKELKALTIIKEKSIDVHSFLIGINLNTYEDFIQKGRKYCWYTNEPTKEEYELLKEVLL